MQAARSHGNLTFVFIQMNTNNMHLMPLPNLRQSLRGPPVRAAHEEVAAETMGLQTNVRNAADSREGLFLQAFQTPHF